MVGWSAGCGESYVSGAGSAGRKPTTERQQGRRPSTPFGITVNAVTPLLRREDTQKFMDLVRMAEAYGAEALGTIDSAFISGDTFVRTTLMAMASVRARIGPRPTNPLTREPQVMAAFLASIDSLTNGRAFMDIASGDSAVFNIGYQAASRARIEDYVTCVRDPPGPRDSLVSRPATAGALGCHSCTQSYPHLDLC
jgi:Luciferase-like monooxygenase